MQEETRLKLGDNPGCRMSEHGPVRYAIYDPRYMDHGEHKLSMVRVSEGQTDDEAFAEAVNWYLAHPEEFCSGMEQSGSSLGSEQSGSSLGSEQSGSSLGSEQSGSSLGS